MKILITNDDGIHAEGMIPFVRWAQKLGEVSVYAPKIEQSGKSHGIDIHSPFEVTQVELVPGVRAYAVDSTPADCVRYAVLGRHEQYDLVFSGINRGYNMGTDILYSGTVGAATEAACLGLNSIAVSTEAEYYEQAVEHLDKVWDYFCRNQLMDKHGFYNVNIPPQAGEIHITRQGGPYYSDDFHSVCDTHVKAHGRCVYEKGDDLSVDTHCVMNGHISVMPMLYDRTDMKLFKLLQK